MYYLACYLAFHLLCGVLSYGIFLGYFQREFPTIAEETLREDIGTGILLALPFGPIGLIIGFLMSGFCKHGLKFK